jgi:hypothetical protein
VPADAAGMRRGAEPMRRSGVDTSVFQTPGDWERANSIRRNLSSLASMEVQVMKRLCKLALVLGAAALVASPALAQRGGGRGGFGGGTQLLNNKSVQEELKMDKDQIDKVKEALDKVREDNKDDIAKLRDRNTSQEERAEIGKKISEANQKAIAGILKADQEKRFKQIQHQQQGLRVFQDADVEKALKLTDDQKEKIKAVGDDLQKDLRALNPGGGGRGGRGGRGGDPETQKKRQALQKEAMTNAKKVLSDEQKKTLDDLTGKPFEIKFEAPRGRGRDL